MTQSSAPALQLTRLSALLWFLIFLVSNVAAMIMGQQAPLGGALSLLIALASLLAYFLARRGRVSAGIHILLGWMMVSQLLFNFQISGLSIPLTLLLLPAVMAIGAATLPLNQAGRLTIVAALVSMFSILLDQFVIGVVAFFNVPQVGEPRLIATWVVALLLFAVFGGYFLRQFPRFPFRIKVLVAFLVTAMLPVAVLAWMNIVQTGRLLESEASRDLSGSAAQIAHVIDDFILTELDTIRTEAANPAFVRYLSLTPDIQANSREELDARRLINALARKDPVFISSYALLNANGTPLLDSYTQDLYLSKSDRDYFRQPFASGLPYVSPVRFSPTAQESGRMIYFSSPVRDESGRILGVLRVRYSIDIFQNLITTLTGRTDPDAYTVLVDQDTIRLAHSLNPELIGKAYAPLDSQRVAELVTSGMLPPGATPSDASTDQPDIAENLRQVAGLNSSEPSVFTASAAALGGEGALLAAVNLQTAPWQVLVRKPLSIIQAPIKSQQRGAVALALLAVVVVAIAAALLTQVLTAPVVRLTDVARQVTAGDLAARAAVETDDEIGALALSFNSMTANLQDTLQGLESRVAERTRAIELSADVSRRLSTILDPAQLVAEVVDLLQFAFNFYHVHIYLFDDSGAALRMVGGTGEVGRVMLQRGHTIPRGRGLVGRACENGVPVLVGDTSLDPNWLPNPLLPETRAEAAVPIIYGDQVLGALDVQQNRVDGLTQQDVDLLQGIANQVAIALRNARQVQQAQEEASRQAQVNAMVRAIQSTQSVEAALQVGVRELGRLVNASAARLRLGTTASAATVTESAPSAAPPPPVADATSTALAPASESGPADDAASAATAVPPRRQS